MTSPPGPQPLVSIVTPSYGQGSFIERTICSIKNQDYPRLEHVIMDGGSKDGTVDVLRRYEGTYPMRWRSGPDEGQTAAVNKALGLASGEIVGWLNSDDVYVSKTVVSAVVAAFADHPDVGVVYGNVLEIDDGDNIRRLRRNIPWFSQRLLAAFNFLSQPAVFFRRNAVAGFKLNTELDFVMDYELWLRLGEQQRFFHLDRFLAGVRYHSGAKNLRNQHDLLREAAQVRKAYSRGGAGEAFDRIICKLLFRFYRLTAVTRINALANEQWAVPLHLPSKARVAFRQIPPFGWLERRLAPAPRPRPAP